ncbi:MAG: hypothetical protein ABIN55_12330 [Aeromicrobium sp.]
MKRSRLAAAVVAATLTLTLTGCGGGDKSDLTDLSASKILAKTVKAAAAADSVSVSGEGEDEGTSIEIDLEFAGEDGSGTIEVDGTEITLLGVDGAAYFKAGPELFSSFGADGAQVARLIGDKWIVIDENASNFSDFASFVGRDAFFKSLLDPEGKVTKGKEKKIDGVDTIGLETKSGTLYVDVESGRPISLQKSGDGGTLSFDYDDVDAPEAPAADEVFDLSQIDG